MKRSLVVAGILVAVVLCIRFGAPLSAQDRAPPSVASELQVAAPRQVATKSEPQMHDLSPWRMFLAADIVVAPPNSIDSTLQTGAPPSSFTVGAGFALAAAGFSRVRLPARRSLAQARNDKNILFDACSAVNGNADEQGTNPARQGGASAPKN